MVSVIVPTWNHEKYITQALNSVLDQTYRDIEVVLIDNCSADSTLSIAEDILLRSALPYTIVRNDTTYNLAHNLNIAYSKSNGEYISFCSGDDWLHHDSIRMKMKYFEDPKVGMVYSDGYKYYDDLDVYEPFEGEHFENSDILTELYKRNFISAVGGVIKHQVINEVGLWDEQLLTEDGDMWVRIAKNFKIIHIKDKLFFYRKHAEAFSVNYDLMLQGKMQLYERFKDENPTNDIWLKNARENYLLNRVNSDTSLATFREVIKNYKPNIFFTKLLIKSLLPVSLKKSFYKMSMRKKWKHIKP